MDKISFSDYLKATRQREGLSQRDFANKVELDRSTVYKLESAQQLPTERHIVAIAKGIGTSPLDLLRMFGFVERQPDQTLLNRIDELPPDRRRQLEQYLELLESAPARGARIR